MSPPYNAPAAIIDFEDLAQGSHNYNQNGIIIGTISPTNTQEPLVVNEFAGEGNSHGALLPRGYSLEIKAATLGQTFDLDSILVRSSSTSLPTSGEILGFDEAGGLIATQPFSNVDNVGATLALASSFDHSARVLANFLSGPSFPVFNAIDNIDIMLNSNNMGEPEDTLFLLLFPQN